MAVRYRVLSIVVWCGVPSLHQQQNPNRSRLGFFLVCSRRFPRKPADFTSRPHGPLSDRIPKRRHLPISTDETERTAFMGLDYHRLARRRQTRLLIGFNIYQPVEHSPADFRYLSTIPSPHQRSRAASLMLGGRLLRQPIQLVAGAAATGCGLAQNTMRHQLVDVAQCRVG